jgi:hypothetical protein
MGAFPALCAETGLSGDKTMHRMVLWMRPRRPRMDAKPDATPS